AVREGLLLGRREGAAPARRREAEEGPGNLLLDPPLAPRREGRASRLERRDQDPSQRPREGAEHRGRDPGRGRGAVRADGGRQGLSIGHGRPERRDPLPRRREVEPYFSLRQARKRTASPSSSKTKAQVMPPPAGIRTTGRSTPSQIMIGPGSIAILVVRRPCVIVWPASSRWTVQQTGWPRWRQTEAPIGL